MPGFRVEAKNEHRQLCAEVHGVLGGDVVPNGK
jgi:hypothetical protein